MCAETRHPSAIEHPTGVAEIGTMHMPLTDAIPALAVRGAAGEQAISLQQEAPISTLAMA